MSAAGFQKLDAFINGEFAANVTTCSLGPSDKQTPALNSKRVANLRKLLEERRASQKQAQ